MPIDDAHCADALVKATARAGAVTFDNWEYAVSAYVIPDVNVATCSAVAYSGDEALPVAFFDYREVPDKISGAARLLRSVQSADWCGVKCSVARSGRFRLEYSYDRDEAVTWVGEYFGGSPDEVLVEVLRPKDL